MVFLLLPLMLQLPAAEPAQPAAPAWEHVHQWLAAQRDQMSLALEQAHATLSARARAAGDEALLERLSLEPPRPRPHGYGILPEIVEDGPHKAVVTRKRTYSLESLSTAYTKDFRDAAVLAGRTSAESDLPLEPWVTEFERLRDRMRNLEDHLEYHSKWQVEVVAYPKWFAQRNRVIDRVREMVRLEQSGAPPAQVEEVREEVMQQLAPFRPTQGLRVERRGDGVRLLRLLVSTDIDDDEFLDAVRGAVERTWSESDAARALRFALELRWRRIPPGALYPEGAPARGSAIDMDDHVGRFPEGELLLTTGAKSTHAWTGLRVVLGPAPLAPRVLAHEFGHLLGFDDAYLRGYEGDPRDAYGAVLVEWVGLRNDLMGNPSGGQVTAAMIERILEAYRGGAGGPPPAD